MIKQSIQAQTTLVKQIRSISILRFILVFYISTEVSGLVRRESEM